MINCFFYTDVTLLLFHVKTKIKVSCSLVYSATLCTHTPQAQVTTGMLLLGRILAEDAVANCFDCLQNIASAAFVMLKGENPAENRTSILQHFLPFKCLICINSSCLMSLSDFMYTSEKPNMWTFRAVGILKASRSSLKPNSETFLESNIHTEEPAGSYISFSDERTIHHFL